MNLYELAKTLEFMGHKNMTLEVLEALDRIRELEAKNAKLRATLEQIRLLASVQIPAYAYSDNEAGCYMRGVLSDIQNSARALLEDK